MRGHIGPIGSLMAASAGTRAKKDVPKREPILPAVRYNFLDAQASVPEDSDSFEARWRRSFLEAFGK